MNANDLHENTSLDDGDCLSFHAYSFPQAVASISHPAYELLVLPAVGPWEVTLGETTIAVNGERLLLTGPKIEREFSALPAGGTLVSIRWPADIFGERLLDKNQLRSIGALLEQAGRGILFESRVIPDIRQRLAVMRQKKGFAGVLDLLSLLHQLSTAEREMVLACPPPSSRDDPEPPSRIDSAVAFMRANYFRPMTLSEIARRADMTKGAFCRSLRRQTGKSYAESLNEIRIGHICRLLLETSDNVSEIAYRVGYQNIHHFHRSFKRHRGCTPKQFRERHRITPDAFFQFQG
ncbi:MAG: helix-turn-helix transcriptional regulator [Bacteroidetes bacterium]|nr:helix-turn-helix transcriptional regulator [Bacteroidota bacterium]